MPRVLRYQYPGAVYHLMARGEGGKMVFETDEDRKGFLFRLGKVCECHGWRVHAWVLMGNHFHLLVETPEANLVTGMKLLLGTFSQGWNRRRMRRGHVFQGRYKSIPVNASDSDPHYFKIVADYIHLNPARAGLAGGKKGKLTGYRWSSLPSHAKGNGPDWLETGRLLRAFELAGDGRGRRAYVDWLEARAARDDGRIDEKAMKALRRGWYLGEATFGDRLLDLMKKPSAKKSRASEAPKEHGEAEAERLAIEALTRLGLAAVPQELAQLRKGDERKVLVACLLRQRTSVGNPWIAKRLAMGHSGSVSRLVMTANKHPQTKRKLDKLAKLLKCNT
jgi:REP element-mobilizing transposase RayT